MFPAASTFQSQAAQMSSPQLATYGTPGSTYGSPGSSYGSPSVLGRAIMGPELVMSGRHQGFCLYLARLIRYKSLQPLCCYCTVTRVCCLLSPFWNVTVVKEIAVAGQKETQVRVVALLRVK